jgi:hypothetical protein
MLYLHIPPFGHQVAPLRSASPYFSIGHFSAEKTQLTDMLENFLFPQKKMTSQVPEFSNKMAHRRISQDMLWKFLVEHFVEHVLAGVIPFCGHRGAVI